MNTELIFQSLYNRLNQLSPIPLSEWEEFRSHLKVSQYKQGDFLVRQEDENLFLGFLVKGLTHSHYSNEDGLLFTKNFSWEGRLIGPWNSILRGDKATFNVQALEDCVVVAIDAATFMKMAKATTCWAMLSKAVTEYLFIERETREYDGLVFDNLKRYQNFIQRFDKIVDRIPQHLIASYLRDYARHFKSNFK